jgi:hypothetical protein
MSTRDDGHREAREHVTASKHETETSDAHAPDLSLAAVRRNASRNCLCEHYFGGGKQADDVREDVRATDSVPLVWPKICT